ncbi:hypothetical protein [Christiangramia sabulilitoris]|uniref:Uncharacterized protein n=1 Tax=Christiangramia sabulilitoris TaxID=2583991 RepID=A0A550I7J8_9FLAO|nr:hypothetical protein [Christiangramia sabulilitoris]TRO66949.1 hypothetical protein FGM01_03400 [Christiangramia sabulilitoris]
MAAVKFNNSHDLINYLCRDEVLGEVKIEYTQLNSSMLEAAYFNFQYPALEQHLDSIAWDIIETNEATASKIQVTFYEDEQDYNYTLDAIEDEFESIDDEYHNLLESVLGPNAFAVISLEGTDYNLDSTEIKKWEFFENTPEGERKINPSKEEGDKILDGIFSILQNCDSVIECMEEYEFTIDNEKLKLTEKGALIANNIFSLQDDEFFELDTDLLKKE